MANPARLESKKARMIAYQLEKYQSKPYVKAKSKIIEVMDKLHEILT